MLEFDWILKWKTLLEVLIIDLHHLNWGQPGVVFNI